jgi:hypothetical protein
MEYTSLLKECKAKKKVEIYSLFNRTFKGGKLENRGNYGTEIIWRYYFSKIR